MENILKISYQIILVIAFVVFFLVLLASPIIYINIKQRNYYKQLAQKFKLQLAPRQHIIKRDFPIINGTVNRKRVWVKATRLGEYSYNLHYDTQYFANPAVAIGIEFKHPKIAKLSVIQKELFSTVVVSDFDKYYDINVEPQEYKNIFFNYDIKQQIMMCSQKHASYFNLNLVEGYLMSVSNFELISTQKYNNIVDKFVLMTAITNIKK